MNIYEKLQLCRVELQDMKLKKSGENKFSGFKYYELKDFLPKINELFKEHGLFSNFSIKDGQAILEIIDKDWISQEQFKDESLEFFRQNSCFFKVVFTSPIAEANVKGCTAIQSLGAVHTYMKRYLYLNALEIVEDDSLDGKVGSKDFQTEDTDMDIYTNIESLDNFEDLQNYYNSYKDKVKDRQRFNKAINNRNRALKGEQ